MHGSKTSRIWSKWQHFVWAPTPFPATVFPALRQVHCSMNLTKCLLCHLCWCCKGDKLLNFLPYLHVICVLLLLGIVIEKKLQSLGNAGNCGFKKCGNWVQLSLVIVALRGDVKQPCGFRVGHIHINLIWFFLVQLKHNLCLTNYWNTVKMNMWLLQYLLHLNVIY